MSKFTIKLELQGLKIEVEGSKDDAPRLAQQIGRQLGGLLQAPAALASGNGIAAGANVLDGGVESENGAGKKQRKQRKAGAGGRAPSETIALSHDPATYGSPLQGWTTTQKAIWFLHIASKQASVAQLTATNIAKNFNKNFRASGIIHGGNVGQGLEKERLKGVNATVNADMSDGTAKYFLTQAGIAFAEKLGRGEAVAPAAD